MKSKHWPGALALLAFGLADCAKQPPVPPAPAMPTVPAAPTTTALVAPRQRSSHFEAVSRQLELGGTLYGYLDIDGDPEKLASSVQAMARQLAATVPAAGMIAHLDFKGLFADLGLDDIKAMGISSVSVDGGQFSDRMYFYTPAGRHGFLAGLGGLAAPFALPHLAPADTDLYAESEADVPAIYAAVKLVIARVSGQAIADTVDTQLQAAGAAAGISALDVIKHCKGRTFVILRLEPDQTFVFPGPVHFVTPRFSLLLGIEGVGAAVEGALGKVPVFVRTDAGTRHLYTPKVPIEVDGLQPTIAVDGTTLYFSTSGPFLSECLARPSGLDQNPEFQRLLGQLGPTGNGLSYVTPRLFEAFRGLAEKNPQVDAPVHSVLEMIARQIPPSQQPLMLVRQNLSDGILVRAIYNRSFKRELLLPIIYNPLMIGLLAAQVAPNFQKNQTTARDHAIQLNLRKLWTASRNYYLTNNAESALYDDLVGPGKAIPVLVPAAGEDYRYLRFEKGHPLRLRTPDGRVFVYPPPPADAP